MREELKTFISFLKQNNAYSNYRHNCRTLKYYLFFHKFVNQYNIITLSFDFFSTREKFPYWEEIDAKWRVFLDNNRREYKYGT